MTEPIKMPPFTGRLASSPEQPLISEYARLAVEQNTAELRAEVERLREALNVASGALLQCEPCMADECAQVQREWLDDARRLIAAAIRARGEKKTL
jgi:hypothetical protein